LGRGPGYGAGDLNSSRRARPLRLGGRRSRRLGELRQSFLKKVIGLGIHRKRLDLPRGGQAAHRFTHPRAGGNRGEKNLDLLPRGGVHRLQIHGDQKRQRGYLRSSAGSGEGLAMAHAEQFPASRLARVREPRGDAQGLPELAQSAQNRGFRQLPAQGFPRLGGGEHSILVQGLPQLEYQGGDLMAGGFLRRMLPIRIGAQAKNVGQRLLLGQEIRLLTHPAQQIQGYHLARCNQAGQQCLRLLQGGRAGGRLRAPHAGFDEGRRGRRQLRPPRQIKA
jgi:hypothetical protein